jgi:hypothetical protein
MKVHSAAIRLTTSSGVNIDAIAITRMDAIRRSRPIADAVSGSRQSGLSSKILGFCNRFPPHRAE